MSDDNLGQIILDLEKGSEWRFELEQDEDVAVRVHSPDPVYINSEELPPTTWYPIFRNTKAALYTPSDARIELSALPSSQYTSSSTTQPHLITLHLALERLRILAKRNSQPLTASSPSHPNDVTRGPRLMALGPPSSGKTTIVKNLVNMALGSGMGWTVGVASLDPASPSNLIPGSLSLSTPSHPIPTHHLAHPLGSPPASLPSSSLAADVPTIGWWYGNLEPTTRGAPIWTKLVASMAESWRKKCEKNPLVNISGLFIDTPSAFTNATLGTRKEDPKARYTLLLQAIEAFEVDTLLVIGHEKLSIELDRLLSNSPTQVVRFPKSTGVVDLDDSFRQIAQAWQVRSYFYGEPAMPKSISGLVGRSVPIGNQLSPYSFQIGWETLHVLRVGEENAAPSTALPLGSSRILSPTRLTRVDPSGPAHLTRLLNTVLAIVSITAEDRITPAPNPAVSTIKQEAVVTVKEEIKADPTVKTELVAGGGTGVEGEGGEGEVKANAENGNGGVGKEAAEVASGEGVPETEPEGETNNKNGEEMVEETDVVDAVAGAVEEDEDEVPFREEIGTREVLGFIVITAIDPQRRKYTVLSPSPGKLPSTVAIAGSIEWVDAA